MKKITKFINQIIKDTKNRMACDSIFLMAVFGLFLFGIIFILSCIGSLCNFEPNMFFFERGIIILLFLMGISSISIILYTALKVVYSFILYLIKVWKSL